MRGGLWWGEGRRGLECEGRVVVGGGKEGEG